MRSNDGELVLYTKEPFFCSVKLSVAPKKDTTKIPLITRVSNHPKSMNIPSVSNLFLDLRSVKPSGSGFIETHGLRFPAVREESKTRLGSWLFLDKESCISSDDICLRFKQGIYYS